MYKDTMDLIKMDKEADKIPTQSQFCRWIAKFIDPIDSNNTLCISNIYSGLILGSVVESWLSTFDHYSVPPLMILRLSHLRKLCYRMHKLLSSLSFGSPRILVFASKHRVGVPVHMMPSGSVIQRQIRPQYRSRSLRIIYNTMRYIKENLAWELKQMTVVPDSETREILRQIMRINSRMSKFGLRQTITSRKELYKAISRRKIKITGAEEEVFEIMQSVLAMHKGYKNKNCSSGDKPYRDLPKNFIAWGPHLFETYIFKIVSKILEKEEWHGIQAQAQVEKKCRHDVKASLRPDIILERRGQIFGCIDAKLYNRTSKIDEQKFAHKMDQYLFNFCSTPRTHMYTGRGVTFVALYGGKQTHFGRRERGSHLICYIDIFKKDKIDLERKIEAEMCYCLDFILSEQKKSC